MRKMKLCRIVMVLFVTIWGSACKKDWLDAKPNKSLVVPVTIADYQALLDNTKGFPGMNQYLPNLSMLGDGDFLIKDVTYNAVISTEKGAYTWASNDDFYGGQGLLEWINAYARILQANVVLDGLTSLKLDVLSHKTYNNVKGSALFYRSYDFYSLAQEFCKVYDPATASTDLGLPLRLSSNINLTVSRASVQETYDQITNDLLKAVPLLPPTPLYPTRPSKASVYGLLARIYLVQENYGKALIYADSCLQIQNELMDYNQLMPSAVTPIAYFNKEVIYHATLSSYASSSRPNLIVDPLLYQSYETNDLRPGIFFMTTNGDITMHSGYGGSAVSLFGGLATDEIYLIRAECLARAGNTSSALKDLNTLLETRWKTGTFINREAASADEALGFIIKERRKELCFRNLRWQDLRRLNKDPNFQVTLTRTVNGQTYTLLPNSPRYVLPIDPVEILKGGLQQNPR